MIEMLILKNYLKIIYCKKVKINWLKIKVRFNKRLYQKNKYKINNIIKKRKKKSSSKTTNKVNKSIKLKYKHFNLTKEQ